MPPNRAVHDGTLCGGIVISQRAFTPFLFRIGWNFPDFTMPKQALINAFYNMSAQSVNSHKRLSSNFTLQNYYIFLNWAIFSRKIFNHQSLYPVRVEIRAPVRGVRKPCPSHKKKELHFWNSFLFRGERESRAPTSLRSPTSNAHTLPRASSANQNEEVAEQLFFCFVPYCVLKQVWSTIVHKTKRALLDSFFILCCG
jgi:hypothetical protein